MMTIVNRFRGTYGWFAKVNGVVLGLIVYIVFGNLYVSLAVAIGYVLGESFGWGDWVGCLTTNRNNCKDTTDEGKANGIMWLSQKIVPDWRTNFIEYSRVALTIRGFYWWLPTLAPLYFVADSLLITVSILFLSIGFPIACEIGYLLRYKDYSFWKLSYKGGWEMQEGVYGLMQDIVLIGGLLIWV